jgi:hydrophobe/amphiphile efflux-1 (HAE1) family protein
MQFSRQFVDRPILAAVFSIVIFLAGLLAMGRLPISEYPEVAPPTVVVTARYPGANPTVIAETVAAPLEQTITGVENMLYMSSESTADGTLRLTVSFALGTNIDQAQVQVQNRVSQATPRLPEEVRRLGITTLKSSPNILMVVHLYSPDRRYDMVYLRNYAVLQVRDELARLHGVGDVRVFGAGDYAMRVWLDPDKVAALGLTAGDVVQSIREQNVQVAAGTIGGQPTTPGTQYQLLVNARGRLASQEEFGRIVIHTGANGEVSRLSDVARLELGPAEYSLRSLLNNQEAVALPIFQAPGSNALDVSTSVRDAMAEMAKSFPQGVTWSVVYDPTVFVRKSIDAVVHTLFEAILLVVIVVVLFLQTWRASIIPLVAVPVSIVGTFALMWLFGFSINALSLFGMVLAIGIVVDDAIVVVENVERNIEEGLAPRDAAYKAMGEVSGAIVAIALVLCAVFVPIAFIPGLTGEFYRQFALTIAISTVISAFNSLTLSPALAALLLQPRGAPPDALTRLIDRVFGGFFRRFNAFFSRSSERYHGRVGGLIGRRGTALGVYALLLALTAALFWIVPSGFVPVQDKQYLVAFAQLPDAASLDRTERVVRRMGEIAREQPGVADAVQFPGLSIAGFTNASNAAVLFLALDDFESRRSRALSGPAIAQSLNQRFGAIQEAFIGVFPPPPVDGIGTLGGFKVQVEDRRGLGYGPLYGAVQQVVGATYSPAGGRTFAPGTFSTFQISVPQLFADVDRDRVKQQNVPLASVYDAMQVYLGSLYVNDFNLFGRTYQVIAQADAPFRDQPEDIRTLKTRNLAGEMVPLGSLVTVRESFGPDRVTRYNGYPSADIQGTPARGVSSGQAVAAIESMLKQTLPIGLTYEWTELTYQQKSAGSTGLLVFPLCVLLVFLVLAALYESWSLPLAVILIVPMCLLSAMAGVWLSGVDAFVPPTSALATGLGWLGFNGQGADNNVFTQIGLVVLVGLACKNAILIVEFARDLERTGHDPVTAALEACRLRLRPILMTSLAFIAGVVPLVTATGAGAEMRNAMGVAVFAGMLGVTLFGLFLTPVFYVVIRRLELARTRPTAPPIAAAPAAGDGASVGNTGVPNDG